MSEYLRGLNRVAQGKTIKAIRPILPHELDEMGWPEPNKYEPALLIELDDGARLVMTQDSEGNGPGAIATLGATL